MNNTIMDTFCINNLAVRWMKPPAYTSVSEYVKRKRDASSEDI